MRKIRIGNDIAVQWSLVAKGTGEPFVVEGKDIRLSLKSIFATTEIEDFTAQGNAIAWTFKGAEQKQTGIYSLVVSVVDAQGAMVTTDVCQFVELVACSCEADGADEAGVQTESIDLVSNVEIGGNGGSSYDDTELREAIEALDNRVAAHSEDIVNLQENKATKQELTELSAEIGKKQDTITDLETIRSGAAKGATALQSVPDTYATKTYVDDAIKDIPAPTPSASNEWKCVFDGRMEEGKSAIFYTTYADGTPLKAREAIIEVINDIKASADITGYVRIQSTLNKNKCSFGIITYESTSVGDGKIMVQDVRVETSEHFFTKAYIAKDMKNSIAHNSVVGEEIGHAPQIFEDIVSIELASNLSLTEAAPFVRIYAR